MACTITTETPPAPPPSGDCSCGRKLTRIVGGTVTQNNQYPWQILLLVDGQHVCGGSLISKDWVVTAAHCMDYSTSRYSVALGEHDKSSSDSITIVIPVSDKIIHESYSNLDNDIGLFKLQSSVSFTSEISPICLPMLVSSPMDTGDVLTVTGWGTTSSGGSTSNQLREVDVNYICPEDCRSSSYQYGNEVTDNMFCAGVAAGGKDSCQGDSGGPIFYEDPNTSTSFLIGIVSWGYGCAVADAPGVYTKVDNYIDWIKTNTNAASDFCEIELT